MPLDIPVSELLTRDEAADVLGCSVRTVARHAQRGRLERVRLDRRTVRFRRADLIDFAGKSTRATAPSEDVSRRDPRGGRRDRERRPE